MQNATQEPKPASRTFIIDVAELSGMLGCSTRHVRRLRDSGKLPESFKLGSLTRWNRSVIQNWIADGCPAVESSDEQEDSDSETTDGNSSAKLAEGVTAP